MRFAAVPALAATLALAAPPAQAAPPSPLIGPYAISEPRCYDPTQANADFEAYGPTDVNAQSGNGRVTAGENEAGTLTVFKYPNPSYYNHVKYFTVGRDAHGKVVVQHPNEGAFAGAWYRTASGAGFAWLRDWATSQRYDSDDAPVPVTTHVAPPAVGLVVTETDLVAAPGLDAFQRQFTVDRLPGSPVVEARLVFYENFNPVGNRIPYLPVTDWCLSQLSDQQASYDATAHAIVHSWAGVDGATAAPTSVAFAFGWDGADSGHQVGADAYEASTLPGGTADGYDQAAQAPHRLGGATSAAGQVTGALETALSFSRDGRATARVTIAAGSSLAGAVATLAQARAVPFDVQLGAVNREWHAWLAPTLLPRSHDARVIEVAKRSLISLRLAIAPETGAIVASSDTQGPYGEDWIRDGSFLNEMLDINGYHDLVSRHNLFYAGIQASPLRPSASRPYGNWPMASYADGVDGAPIPWEIDETGLGAWTLWHHAEFLAPAERTPYLASVYPAIGRAADFMTACQDPATGLQCFASEDDNYTPSQSLHGAEAVVLGLRSAVAAAAASGDTSARVTLWQGRLATLETAVDALYDTQSRSYKESGSLPNGYNVDYGDGGWLLWPVTLHPYADPRMVGEAARVDASMRASLAAPIGQYEAKALLGLAHAWAGGTPAQHTTLQTTLSYIASTLTTNTGHFGESWTRRFGPRPLPVQDQPHVWEHALFYLAALQVDGSAPYTFAAPRPTAPPPGPTLLPATASGVPLTAVTLGIAALVGAGLGFRRRRRRPA